MPDWITLDPKITVGNLLTILSFITMICLFTHGRCAERFAKLIGEHVDQKLEPLKEQLEEHYTLLGKLEVQILEAVQRITRVDDRCTRLHSNDDEDHD